MSYFNSNITGSSGSGGASGLVTKFEKTIAISSSELAEVTIDISSDVSNYKDVTNDRIIVELNNASAIAVGDANLNHTYNAETGVITITSTNSSIPFASNSAAEFNVNVYVVGAVQMPPAPVLPTIDGYEITEGYATIDSSHIMDMITGETISVSINTKTLLGTADDIIICVYAERNTANNDVGNPYSSINNAKGMVTAGNKDKEYIPMRGVGLNSEYGGYGSIAILRSEDGKNPFSVSPRAAGGNWNSASICKLSPKTR